MNLNDLPRVQYDLIRLTGGMDQVTPTLSLKPGVVRRAANFECSITGGYTRIAGYERFDGRSRPSAANYNILSCNVTGTIAVGNTVTGYTSAATGKVIARDGASVVITRETGNFLVGEGVSVSGVIQASVTAISGIAAEGVTDATYKYLAAEDYRVDIQAVPGSGSILGVAFYNGNVYAWRNNAGGTALAMYKSSSTGWVAINLLVQLPFDDGTNEITAGVTVTGGSSGATGTVQRVAKRVGSWAGSPQAEGMLVLSGVTGTFVNNEQIRVGGTKYALVNGASSQLTWLPSGRVQSVVANFGGAQDNKKLYFCDGKNRAFEWDGSVLVPITTTMSPDVPTGIVVHKQHLFLAFKHSLQFSSLGSPYEWDPVTGAGEIAMNDDITNLVPLPGDQSSGALAVYTKTDTSVLYGTSEANFSLSNFNVGTGAYQYTGQNLDQTYILAERGVMALGTTLNFGNFAASSLTMNIRPYIQIRRNLATASLVNREKGQYRLFFSDGYGLYLTVANGQYMGSMPVQFPNPVTCSCEGQDPDGAETSFFGSTNGFVYMLDAGTSFDGAAIPANITTVYNSINSPRVLKRYRKASIEMTGDSYAGFQVGYDLGYRSPEYVQPLEASFENDLRSAFWDSFIWDNFVWDGRDLSPSEVEITGTAENIAVRVSSVSEMLEPFTVNSIIVHYTLRRGLR